jgi:hypothetical protein
VAQSTKNIVLVHGGFVDGLGWESVFHVGASGIDVVEVAGSHAIYVSQPNAVAALIKQAAQGVAAATAAN